MNAQSLVQLAQEIVSQARILKDLHTTEAAAAVNYVAVFAQSEDEFAEFLAAAEQLGHVVQHTPTGPLFQVPPIDTVSGKVKLLKVRAPDKARVERGDADFTVSDYLRFKKENLSRPGFRLILREQFEMIELLDATFDVLAYFSHPPLDQQLGIA